MTGAMAAESPARVVQEKIDALQEELHEAARKLIISSNVKKNTCYMERHNTIMQAIQDGKLPRTFWADAIIAALETPEGAVGEGRLLGEYDAGLLRQYLREMKVTYTEAGFKVTMLFDPNPFFEETELWGEDLHLQGGDDDDDEDELCRFSGVTWKPGHGPVDDDEEEEEGEGGGKNNDNGNGGDDCNGNNRRRGRSEPTTQGWSFLDVFSKMLPHPEDEEFDEADDDDDFSDAVEKWEEEMGDRKDLLMTLVEDVWMDPIAAFKRQAVGGKGEEVQPESDVSAGKRSRTE